ncbi:MAG: cytochrome c3 family protein [Deltaproteobacteria bacterium]|nr:cytochrome c3 family protein [Deltaproteobacteria bacterium]
MARSVHVGLGFAIWVLSAASLATGCQSRAVSKAAPVTALNFDSHDPHFPIANGTHGGADCNTCHGAFESFARFDCTACHEHDAAIVDATHAGIVTGYSYSPTSCYECHPRGQRASFDHAQRFPIDAASHHALVACASCHPNASDRKAFDCTTCHTDAQTTPNHAGVSGYAWSSASCYQCHPTGQASGSGSSHTPFPIGPATTHDNAKIPCASCHPTADKKVFDCTTCHTQAATDPWHTTVTDYAWSSPSCYQCHPQAEVTGFDHNPYFPIDMGATHGALGCSECHKNPANRTQVACTGACHTSPAMTNEHTPVGGYKYDTASCLACHADSQVTLVATHPVCPINRGHHQKEPCLVCHGAKRSDKPFGQDFTKVNCLACHGNKGAICEP